MRYPSVIFTVVLLLLFQSCKVNHFVKATPQSYRVEDALNIKEDQAINAMIQPYQAQVVKDMEVVIGTIAVNLENGSPESNLGNFVADALKQKMEDYLEMEIDFAVSNRGGFRIPNLPEGPVKKSQIFELLPFDNILVVLELDGETVKTLCDHMAGQRGWPVSKGLSYRIVQSKSDEIRINGEPLDMEKKYKVGFPDYVANGGGNSTFLQKIPQISTGKYMRDAVIEYIQEQKQPISAKIEGRVENYN